MPEEGNKPEGYNPGEITPVAAKPWQPPDTPPCYLPQRDAKVPAKDMIMGPIGNTFYLLLCGQTVLCTMISIRFIQDKDNGIMFVGLCVELSTKQKL